MAPRSTLKTEYVLHAAILLLALGLRFANLGGLSLNEHEAAAALPAYQLSQDSQAPVGEQPAYTLLTALAFFAVPSSEFLARFWPALFGSALALLPFFWRDLLGRQAAVLLALGLALDPGFVALSRLASGRMLAVAGLLFAASAWRARRPAAAGALAALALLAAPTVFIGVLGVAILWAFFIDAAPPRGAQWRAAALAAAAMLVLGGTLLLSVPVGLGGIAAPLAAFLAGWMQPSGISILRVLFALAAYGLPALLFGLPGAARAWLNDDALGKLLSLWALVNLALVLLYPGRQAADLLWVLLPLWALAAGEASRYLFIPKPETLAAWGQALLSILLLAFLVLTLARIPANEAFPDLARPYIYIAGGVVLLGAVATLLISLGWSAQSAANGLVWALSLFLALFALTASTRFANPAAPAASELWAPGPAAGQLALLTDTMQELSRNASGQPGQLAVDLRVESAALVWAVRNLPPASGSAAPLIITLASDAEPAEASAYRGQSFLLASAPAWKHAPGGLVSWLLYRRAPQERQHVILWADANLFPDALSALSNGDSR